MLKFPRRNTITNSNQCLLLVTVLEIAQLCVHERINIPKADSECYTCKKEFVVTESTPSASAISSLSAISPSSEVLILIDLQKGFLKTEYWGKRNNPELENNCRQLLAQFRSKGRPVIHVQHLSSEPASPLRPNQEGAEFLEGLEPRLGERVFQKKVNSAFIGTGLEAYLRSENLKSLTLAGLTSDHCVSTTARMGANLGFQIAIPADCVATFERSRDGATYPAELVHDVSLASLNGEFARVIKTFAY